MKVEQTNWKKMQRQRPSTRIWRALRRLTRDRWISGPDLHKIVFSWCSSHGWMMGQVVRGVHEEFVVGMFRGKATAHHWQPDYGRVVDALYRNKKPLDGVTPELFILNLEIQRRVRDGSRS